MRKVTMLAVLATLAAAGCGGGGGSGGGVNNFIGDWYYTGGSITQACAGSAAEVMNLLDYNVSILRTNVVSQVDFTTEFDLYRCTRRLDVRGNTATLSAAADCTDRQYDDVGDPYTLVIRPQSETLTFLGGGALRESSTNQLTYTYDDGRVLNCTSTISSASLSY